MNDSYALLQTIGGPSSSVDPSPDSSRTDEEYMERYGHPRFPAAWYPYKRRGQTLDYYLESLKRFYTIHNGMAVLHNEVCKCVLYPAIPPDLVVVHIEDEIFDTKALRKGYSCELTEDQEVGLKTRDANTATVLLLHTMSECYFKKKGIISKTAEIQRLQKRFSELSLEEITELETSVERRNEELSPAFEKCLAQQNEIELHEGLKRLYIQTWKLQAMFSKNESEQIQKMDDLTKSYSDAMKASEAKNSIISNEVKKWKSKSANNEKRIFEQNVSISKLKKQEEFYRKQYERNERELKEANSEIKSILQDNKSFQQMNFEIQEKRANMQTSLSRLTEENKQLALNLKQNLEREVHNEAKIKSMETELSRTKNILRKLEAERTHMTSEINSVKANKENLLTRLSEVAGDKLTIGTTEITDLSDPDRPTKLGERFREMYDNEWIEALEEILDAGLSDKAAYDFLLDVIMKTFRFCSGTSDKIAAHCLRCLQECYQEIPAPVSKDLQLHDMIPFHEGETRKGVEIMRKYVASHIKGTMKKRCFANIEISLQMTLQRCSDVENQTSSESHSFNTVPSYPSQQLCDNSTEALNNITEHDKKVEADQDDETQNGIKNDSWQVQSNSKGFAEGMDRDTGIQNTTAGYDEAKMQLSDENSSLSYILSSFLDGQMGKKSMKEVYPKFYKYSRKSFDLCWLMRLHSPGLHLDDKIQRGSDFDSNRFRHYTQTGKKVDYLVWPALHLHEGGPLLAKGVAQPIKDKTRKSMAEQQT